MTEEYVSFETAKLLKEKGFIKNLSLSYKDWTFCMYDETGEIHWGCYADSWYPRVTQTLAMKWLREEKYIYIQVMLDSWACGGHSGYYVIIQKTDSDFEMMPSDTLNEVFYSTYEEATEAGIKYCLENLI